MKDKTVGAMLERVERARIYKHPDGRVPTADEMMSWVNEDPASRMQWIQWAYMAAIACERPIEDHPK